MWKVLLPVILLVLFSFFNLLGIKNYLVINQLFFIAAGLVAYVLIRKIGFHYLKQNIPILYWFFILVLVATYIIGVEVKGSKRWIDFYYFNIQPSEIFKVFYVLFLADFFSKKKEYELGVKTYVTGLFSMMLPAVIILKQPDLGNAMVYAGSFFMIALFSRTPKKYIFWTLILFFLLTPLLWNVLGEFQKQRITTFINPTLDQRGAGYNMLQAVITTGSGKFAGKGLGYGTQSKLFYLPENHTDFAFSSLVEQFGFFGGFFIISFYIFLFISLLKKIVQYAKPTWDKENECYFLFLIGFFAILFTQTVINIGMNMGLFPITGITLPFISYGGSSLVSLLIGFALLR